MSHPIVYLLDIPGTTFNGMMQQSYQADAEFLEKARSLSTYAMIPGRLPGNDTDFTAFLDGQWTLCNMRNRYSLFFADLPDPYISNLLDEVHRWERTLRSILPSVEIFRLDDYLYEKWVAKYDCEPYREFRLVKKFIEWLSTQDHLHWSKLSYLN